MARTTVSMLEAQIAAQNEQIALLISLVAPAKAEVVAVPEPPKEAAAPESPKVTWLLDKTNRPAFVSEFPEYEGRSTKWIRDDLAAKGGLTPAMIEAGWVLPTGAVKAKIAAHTAAKNA